MSSSVDVPQEKDAQPLTLRRAGWAVLLFLPAFVSGLWTGAVTIPGGSFWPWSPAMIDLDVYRRTGSMLLAGEDFYVAEGLPWIYPPFAALLTPPLAVVPLAVAQVGWIALTIVLLLAILYRLGLRGWVLALAAAAAVWLVEPVRETLGFGQLGVLLVAAAVLDSMPGRRLLPRRLLPEGVWTGIATAVKLTPAAVAAALFFGGHRRPGLVAFFAFVAATGLGFLVLPVGSLHYWGGLISGDSGINAGIIFHTNQSTMGMWARLFGELSRGGLIASALVAVIGIACAALVFRAGEQRLAIVLAGLTSLLASPISWSHHYVWILPLAVILLQDAHLNRALRVGGLLYCLWVMYAPFKELPGGDGIEATYNIGQQIVVNLGVVAGFVFVVACAVLTTRRRDRERASQTA